ncbi:MAG: transposase [Verrucomicrobia bacterium]|nr:transposase [Verrucomicrobiota bacterium]
MNDPRPRPLKRRTTDLLIGRTSVPESVYFITLCEARRRPGLDHAQIAAPIKATLDELACSGDFALIAATLMPDHLHLLGTLGHRLALSRVIGKLKSLTRTPLAEMDRRWQENYYDHRLREATFCEIFARYLFLNPYRTGLLPLTECWPHWWRWGDVRFEFEALIEGNGHRVPAPWIGEPDPEGAADF